jgi:hypothetical protein
MQAFSFGFPNTYRHATVCALRIVSGTHSGHV